MPCNHPLRTMAHGSSPHQQLLFTHCVAQGALLEPIKGMHPHPPVAGDDFVDSWQQTCHSITTSAQKGMPSAIMLVAWCISKHQNAIIFDNAPLSLVRLLHTIKAEAR